MDKEKFFADYLVFKQVCTDDPKLFVHPRYYDKSETGPERFYRYDVEELRRYYRRLARDFWLTQNLEQGGTQTSGIEIMKARRYWTIKQNDKARYMRGYRFAREYGWYHPERTLKEDAIHCIGYDPEKPSDELDRIMTDYWKALSKMEGHQVESLVAESQQVEVEQRSCYPRLLRPWPRG